jgi:IS1 family transposase
LPDKDAVRRRVGLSFNTDEARWATSKLSVRNTDDAERESRAAKDSARAFICLKIKEPAGVEAPTSSCNRRSRERDNDHNRISFIASSKSRSFAMNTLPFDKKSQILSLLVEGLSVRSIERITGVHRDTIIRLMISTGETAREIMDTAMNNLAVRRLEVDEIWTYVGKKQKRTWLGDLPEYGDQYVFVALDPETKLVPAFRVGKRTAANAVSFMSELKSRIRTRFQLSTDSFVAYREAVDATFGANIDYAQIHKEYSSDVSKGPHRYSPGCIAGIKIIPISGNPAADFISTSLVERQNLTMRMQMRRFTRLTNAFSKRLKSLEGALAVHYFHYNFMRIHQSLRITPAMQAGISSHIWTWEELLNVHQSKAA